jgi:hypothetical protein
MRIVHVALALILLGLPLGGPTLAAHTGAAEACFAETGYCVRGRFLEYWQANGGLARNGFPLTDERRELLEDGKEYTVQYFERVRLEYHPENRPPYDVLLGQFGRRVLETAFAVPPLGGSVPPLPGYVYFPETGQNVSPRFFAYWQANGGLAQFGYPLTSEYEAYFNEPGTGRSVRGAQQYFERGLLEYHPENAPPHDILLGQLGREVLAQVDLLRGEPAFHALYTTNEPLRRQLSGPASRTDQPPLARTQGATQPFERGRMIWRADTRQIYALCGGPQAGSLSGLPGHEGRLAFPDTWAEGEDPGGGLGPAPGLYRPALGFGKLWRENAAVRDCLGHAVAPEGTLAPLAALDFRRGELLLVETEAGRFVYALTFNTYANGVSAVPGSGQYQRFPVAGR